MTTVRLAGAGGLVLVGTRTGDGPLVLLLHGGGQTRHSWDRTAWRLADAGCTALALDMRGHGDSGWAESYDLVDYEADVCAVLDQLGERPAIVGASMGGVAGMLALGHDADGGQGMARSLVLVDVTPRMEDVGVERVRAFMSAAPEGFASLDEAAEAVAGYLPSRTRPVSTRGLEKNLRLYDDRRYRWHWDPAILSGMDHDPQTRHMLLADAARGVRVRTLLVRGGSSDVVSEEGMRELSTLIPHVRMAEIDGAGHMVAGDSNDPFSDAIVDFVRTEVSEAQ